MRGPLNGGPLEIPMDVAVSARGITTKVDAARARGSSAKSTAERVWHGPSLTFLQNDT